MVAIFAQSRRAVGLALKMPDAIVYSFDTDPTAQNYCANLAKLNCVSERVRVKGCCGHDELRQLCGRGSFILCDREGFELERSTQQQFRNSSAQTFWLSFTSDIFGHQRARSQMLSYIRSFGSPDRWYSTLCENRPAPMQWAYLRSKG